MTHCTILLVDDDQDDQEIVSLSFRDLGIKDFHIVSSAQEAISFLQDIDDDRRLPKLIITDLNMPGITGDELLLSLKTMRRYRHIPVIVFSTSSSKEDMKKCLLKGALEFFTKPSAMSEYVDFSKKVKELVHEL